MKRLPHLIQKFISYFLPLKPSVFTSSMPSLSPHLLWAKIFLSFPASTFSELHPSSLQGGEEGVKELFYTAARGGQRFKLTHRTDYLKKPKTNHPGTISEIQGFVFVSRTRTESNACDVTMGSSHLQRNKASEHNGKVLPRLQ